LRRDDGASICPYGTYRSTNTRIAWPTLNTPEVLVTSAAQGYHSYPDSFCRVARLRPVPRADVEHLLSRAKVLLLPGHPQRPEMCQLAEAYQGVYRPRRRMRPPGQVAPLPMACGRLGGGTATPFGPRPPRRGSRPIPASTPTTPPPMRAGSIRWSWWFSILSRWLLKRGEFVVGRRADRQDHRLHRRRNRRAKAVRRVPAQRLNYTRVISARRQHTRFRCDGLANWPEASRKAAQIVIDRPGPPREATGSLLIWEQVGEWKRLMPLKLFIDVRAS